MTRQEAHEFIKLYRKFQLEVHDVKITDIDSGQLIELKVNNVRKDYDDWTAAKVIEANSNG